MSLHHFVGGPFIYEDILRIFKWRLWGFWPWFIFRDFVQEYLVCRILFMGIFHMEYIWHAILCWEFLFLGVLPVGDLSANDFCWEFFFQWCFICGTLSIDIFHMAAWHEIMYSWKFCPWLFWWEFCRRIFIYGILSIIVIFI